MPKNIEKCEKIAKNCTKIMSKTNEKCPRSSIFEMRLLSLENRFNSQMKNAEY